MSTLSIQDVGKWLGIVLEDKRPLKHVHTDGRLCVPGSLYVALKGDRADGHQFLSQAAERGAIAAIVQEGYRGSDAGLILLPVKDPLEAFHALACEVLALRKPFVIGVTGSIGKTTVKEFIATLLATTYRVAKSPESYNGHTGLPLAILNADPAAQVLVLEMAMSHKNEMDRLVEIAQPDFAVITRVAPAHIGHFHSLEEIAIEKAKILSSPRLKFSCIHSRNTLYPFMRRAMQSTYSGEQADMFLTQEGEGWRLVNQKRKEHCVLQLPFSEVHLLENFLVAAMVAREMNVSWQEIQKRAHHLQPFKHRFEKIYLQEPRGAIIIDDSYNNNPVSLKTSLQNLPKPSLKGKVIAVLGEMRELGQVSKMAHEEIGLIALPIVECLLCYGIETRPLYEMFIRHHKEAYHFLEKNALLKLLKERLQEEDILLVKGANSNQLWEVIENLKECVSV